MWLLTVITLRLGETGMCDTSSSDCLQLRNASQLEYTSLSIIICKHDLQWQLSVISNVTSWRKLFVTTQLVLDLQNNYGDPELVCCHEL